MAERGRLYRWPRNRAFGDSKTRPVLVIAPDAATRHGRRWVLLPLTTEPGLSANPLAFRLDPSPANGLESISFVMAWLPSTVLAEALQGPLGRLAAAQVAAINALVIQALDLTCLEPWQERSAPWSSTQPLEQPREDPGCRSASPLSTPPREPTMASRSVASR